MKEKKIRTIDEYETLMEELQSLMALPDWDLNQGILCRVHELVDVIEVYEKEHFPI